MNRKLGNATLSFGVPPVLVAASAIGSKKEQNGPLNREFDCFVSDPLWGETNWEAAESKFLRHAVSLALRKAGGEKADGIVAGDLLNQCTATAFGVRSFHRPFLGVYGACSTIAEAMLVASVMISGGFCRRLVTAASSHFCTAEKQFRMPLEYGGQRTPTAQWTVTGAAAAVLADRGEGPRITHATVGKIVDRGITDASNMGAAMAPAFVDTLVNHFKDTGRTPQDYDLIVSGDLGEVGSRLARTLANEQGLTLSGNNYADCGCLIYSQEQDVHAGGSGCACAGTVFCGYLLNRLRSGALHRILFAPTGALMNASSIPLGNPVLGISYALCVENE